MKFRTTEAQQAYEELKQAADQGKADVVADMDRAMGANTDFAIILQTGLNNAENHVNNLAIALKTATEIDMEIYRTESLLKDAMSNSETEH